MTKRMLIDATHAEETRVVVLDGNRLEDFDVETSTKRQLKGNIYLAKVVRVEPSLQAAFVEYGGGRHGFLAFSEIHPDYYQIPVADRQRLLALQAEEAREEAEAEDAAAEAEQHGGHRPRHRPAPAAHGDTSAQRAGQDSEGNGYADLNGDGDNGGEEAFEEDFETAAVLTGDDDVPPLDLAPFETVDSTGEVSAAPDDAPGAEAPAAEISADTAAPADFDAEPDTAPAAAAAAPDTAAEPAAAEPHDEHDEGERHGRAQPALMARDARYGAVHSAQDDHGGVSELQPDTGHDDYDVPESDLPPPETVGGDSDTGDSGEDARARRTFRFLRNYRIQEVIKRRQILLVQVVKEERGTKGAALTTYISLAGRFCVLMPNSPRGGGISRKITSAADRRRLKEITAELDIPNGMGLIVRTAGANRPKPEIKRDCEYLMRLWDDIREHTLRSIAPALIYEEASLIKRAIRDVYSRDVDEVIVDGDEGWKAAHDFMRMLMPSHARKVLPWRGNAALNGGSSLPLFAKYQVEAQLDAMLSPTVQLRSGGYLVIGQTEALVAIDVNSGRSTRERSVEDTALRTNLEAADEVARQLRLRDLAGLIVIDFIDMEAKKHNAMVERRMKDALKNDRARIQVGHISHFGLMEMSRQRLRPSLAETSFVACPHCGGLGHVRSTESSSIHVLRGIEEEGAKARASLITVYAASSVVMYLLNHKRERLAEIEATYAMKVHFAVDETLTPPNIRIDRLRPALPEAERAELRAALPAPVAIAPPAYVGEDEPEEEAEGFDDEPEVAEVPRAPRAPQAQPAAEARPAGEEAGRRRRRRRRRSRRDQNGNEIPQGAAFQDGETQDGEDEGDDGDSAPDSLTPDPAAPPVLAEGEMAADMLADAVDPALADQPAIDPTEFDENGLPKGGANRRRGRRGGRRRRRGEDGAEDSASSEAAEPVAAAPPPPPRPAPPVYTGPTPANPFGGALDIFDLLDMEAELAPPPPPPPPPVITPVAAAAPAPAEPPAPELVREPAPAPALAAAEPVAEVPAAEVPAAEGPVAAPVVAEPVAPEPAPAEPTAPEAVAPAPEPPPPAGPVVGPAIQPIVLGKDEVPVVERKRGWWKR